MYQCWLMFKKMLAGQNIQGRNVKCCMSFLTRHRKRDYKKLSFNKNKHELFFFLYSSLSGMLWIFSYSNFTKTWNIVKGKGKYTQSCDIFVIFVSLFVSFGPTYSVYRYIYIFFVMWIRLCVYVCVCVCLYTRVVELYPAC